MSTSLKLSKNYLTKTVTVKIDRPYGSKHPKWDFEYKVNQGYLEGITAPDGEDLDAGSGKVLIDLYRALYSYCTQT